MPPNFERRVRNCVSIYQMPLISEMLIAPSFTFDELSSTANSCNKLLSFRTISRKLCNILSLPRHLKVRLWKSNFRAQHIKCEECHQRNRTTSWQNTVCESKLNHRLTPTSFLLSLSNVHSVAQPNSFSTACSWHLAILFLLIEINRRNLQQETLASMTIRRIHYNGTICLSHKRELNTAKDWTQNVKRTQTRTHSISVCIIRKHKQSHQQINWLCEMSGDKVWTKNVCRLEQ